MLPSPADGGRSGRGWASRPQSADGQIGPAAHEGLLTAPLAEALVAHPAGPDRLVEAGIRAGGCFVRTLPLDPTCAAAARRFFREGVAGIGLPSDLVHDGVTMASELAANTLHAQANVEYSGSKQRAVSGLPEFWLYLRGSGLRRELVCKVFDSVPGWNVGAKPGMASAPDGSVSGRGLQVVAGLSAGQWGCHRSRGRLGAWKVPGKAVWFALRVPPDAYAALISGPELPQGRAMDELEAMLADRGLGGQLVRADEPGGAIAVLSVSRNLTVWRHGDKLSWRLPAGERRQMQLGDLVDAAEQLVCAHEENALTETVGA